MDEKFLNIVANTLNINRDDLNEESTAETIQEWDSLNHWVVIGALEDEYNIEFTIDEVTEFRNLGHIYEILMKRLQDGL